MENKMNVKPGKKILYCTKCGAEIETKWWKKMPKKCGNCHATFTPIPSDGYGMTCVLMILLLALEFLLLHLLLGESKFVRLILALTVFPIQRWSENWYRLRGKIRFNNVDLKEEEKKE